MRSNIPSRARSIGLGSVLALSALLAFVPISAAPDEDVAPELYDSSATTPQNDTSDDRPEPRSVRTLRGDRVAFFDDIVVPAGTVLDGEIFCLGGTVRIEGEVSGQVAVVMGTAEIGGRIDGGLTGVLSDLRLDGATIRRELVNVAGTMTRIETQVGGEVINIGLGEGRPGFRGPVSVLATVLYWKRLTTVVFLFAVFLLIAALIPERVRAISDEVAVRYFPAFLVGLLAYLVLPIVLLLLSFTVIGIFIGYFAFLIFKWIGMAALFHAWGRRVGLAAGRELSLLGAMLLGFLPFALAHILPNFLGLAGLLVAMGLWLMIWLFVEVPAIGLVILTRGGADQVLPAVVAPTPPPAIEPSAGPTT